MKHKKIISIVTAACMLSGLSLGGNALTVYADDEVKELVLWDHHTGKEFDFLVIPKVRLSRNLIFQPVSMLISFNKFGITFLPF